MENNNRQQQEWEFVLEGITTRMQLALEKMADSNRILAANNRRLCHTLILAMIIVVLGFMIHTMLMMDRINDIHSGVSASETVLEQRPGAND